MGEIRLEGVELPNNMVIVKDPNGKIKNLLKGFETIMFEDVKKYLIEFLRSEEKYKKYKSVLDIRFERSVPKEKMQSFHLHKTQKEVSFFMGAKAFVDTILDHTYLYDNKNVLAQLTKKFFKCFYFDNQRGMLLFDSDMLARYCLDYGFDAIAEIFRNSEPLQNIRISNNTISNLNNEQRRDRLFDREDISYKDEQKQFFKDKIDYYKNEHFVKEEKEKEAKSKKANDYNFINLFKSKELYEKAINALKNNGFITENNGTLNWVYLETKEYKTSQTLIALCVVLQIKQYFKPSPKAVYNYIKKEFNITIDKGFYSRSANGFKRDYNTKNTKNFSYTSLFKDIL